MPQLRGRHNSNDGASSPVSATENPLARRFRVDEEPDTIDLESADSFRDCTENDQDQTPTRKLGDDQGDPAENPVLKNPVAGFLAVVSGPGRGRVSTLRYGENSIGRDVSQSIALDHGDRGIARENHCTVIYDSDSREFYLQPGKGEKLTYLEGQPVLAPAQLVAGSQIHVGDTILRFVPLCGQDFDWN